MALLFYISLLQLEKGYFCRPGKPQVQNPGVTAAPGLFLFLSEVKP
jgi:hypothetical protein